ncbi:IS3 family transposase [Acholeplasma laidlawii]|uniref:IS3 family transposase n=1 Tax=Acholeplasma laidlawii TaxID=2148 RepID=UPI0021F6CEA1|nr:IS3 family transposase [Acholeplasma laidlawii]
MKWLSELLGIARSAYYKWSNRIKPAYEIKNEETLDVIQAYYKHFDKKYGYRRIRDNINKYTGTQHSDNYIYRLMRAYNLKSIIRRKRPGFVKTKPEQVGHNILNREFFASNPNEKWLSDVTEFKYGYSGQKLYLCAILDVYDKSVVSYHIHHRNDNHLVFTTFNKAVKKNPGAQPMFHSDRGFQYASRSFKNLLDKHNMVQSMSRVGKCIDNGPIENLWGIIKSEMYYLETFDSSEKLTKAIKDYIKFYNQERLQRKLKSHTPLEYRYMAI